MNIQISGNVQLPTTQTNFNLGIVVIPTQGLGNRLRMMACGYALSKLWNVPLFVLWHQAHDCNIEGEELFSPQPHSLFQWMNSNRLGLKRYLYFGQVHTESILKDANRYGSNQWDYLVLVGGHEFKHPQIEIGDLLAWKREFYQQLPWSNTLRLRLDTIGDDLPDQYVAVHYRAHQAKFDDADFHNSKTKSQEFNPVDFTTNSPISAYIPFIKAVKEDMPILVLSNDPQTLLWLQQKFPNKQWIGGISKWFDREQSHAILESALEWILMSRAQLIIGSFFSSFSDESSAVYLVPKVTPVSSSLSKRLASETTKSSGSMSYHCYNFNTLNVPSIHEDGPIYGLHLNYFHLLSVFSNSIQK